MNRVVWGVVFFIFLVPLSIPLGGYDGKNVDLVYSDLLFPVAVFLMVVFHTRIFRSPIDQRSLILLIVPMLLMLIGLISNLLFTIEGGGGGTSLLSMARFLKPLFFSYIAFIFSRCFVLDLRVLSKDIVVIAAIIFAILVFSDIAFGNFPRPRLGGLFFNIQVYGFPNSVAVFYTAFVALFFFYAVANRSIFFAAIGFFAIFFVAFTLSRAAIFTIFTCLIFMTFRYGLKFVASGAVLGLMLTMALAVSELDFSAADPLLVKLEKVSSGDDALSGRDKIWALSLDLIAEKPLMGYGFRPFSDFNARYDTPHEQYLEIAYKVGLLGLLTYAFFLWLISVGIYRMSFHFKSNRQISYFIWGVFSMFLAFLTAGLSQPTLSYPVLGNFYIFLGSLLCFHYYQLRQRERRARLDA